MAGIGGDIVQRPSGGGRDIISHGGTSQPPPAGRHRRGRAGERDAVYTPNGAIYLIKWDHLLERGDWYDPHAYAYVMPPERSLDIDTHADFEAARAMLDDHGQFNPAAIAKKITAPV